MSVLFIVLVLGLERCGGACRLVDASSAGNSFGAAKTDWVSDLFIALGLGILFMRVLFIALGLGLESCGGACRLVDASNASAGNPVAVKTDGVPVLVSSLVTSLFMSRGSLV